MPRGVCRLAEDVLRRLSFVSSVEPAARTRPAWPGGAMGEDLARGPEGLSHCDRCRSRRPLAQWSPVARSAAAGGRFPLFV